MALEVKLRDLIKKFGLHALIFVGSGASGLFFLRFASTTFFFLRPLLLSTAVSLAVIGILRLLSPSPGEDQGNQIAEDFLHFVSDDFSDGASSLSSAPLVEAEDQ